MPPARLVLHLRCPRETLVQRVLGRGSGANSKGATTARAADADPELVRERVGRNYAEGEALVRALVDAGMSVVAVDSDRDVELVKRDVHAHVQVGAMRIVQFGSAAEDLATIWVLTCGCCRNSLMNCHVSPAITRTSAWGPDLHNVTWRSNELSLVPV